MVAKVSGISFALGEIEKLKKESLRSIRVVHVDYSWDPDSVEIDGVLNFFDDADKAALLSCNSATPANSELQPSHGNTCSAILRTNPKLTLNPNEKTVWNLAPLASIYALPLELPKKHVLPGGASRLLQAVLGRSDFANETLKTMWENFEDDWYAGFDSAPYQDTSTDFDKIRGAIFDFIDYRNAKCTFDATFDRLISLCSAGELENGDIIVCPVSATSRECCPLKAKAKRFDFPILQFDSVREKIATLTGDYGVSVIVAAGNSGLDLSHGQLPLFFGTQTKQSIYQNRGVSCGAILIGADTKHSSRNETREVNTGKCIDGSGRYKLDNVGTFSPIFQELSKHWTLSSGASMVAAACLANIQHYRSIIGQQCLKPYEARAHMRQWAAMVPTKALGIVNSDGFMGSPPDLEAWMKGTSIIS